MSVHCQKETNHWLVHLLSTTKKHNISITFNVSELCGLDSQCRSNEGIVGSGKPWGVGILGRGVYEPWEGNRGVSLRATWERGGRILSQQGGFQVS
jgi:hypothetical protein